MALWGNGPSGWQVLAPTGFPSEAELHSLVEDAPQLLPLAGSPQLVVLGREVALGPGSADLLAVEPTGRLAIAEVKLAKNAEARRAIVAQVLAYAAFLHRMPLEELQGLVVPKLRARGFDSITSAVADGYQEAQLDPDRFEEGLRESLARGAFRLVLVLDEAPPELVRLVGYFESITQSLVIDLVTVTSYEVNGTQIMVPQRVDAERPQALTPTGTRSSEAQPSAVSSSGSDGFLASIESVAGSVQPALRRLYDWARDLERRRLAKLSTTQGSGRTTLRPLIPRTDAGLVTLVNEGGRAALWLWRTVFDRHAPDALEKLQQLISPATVGSGTTLYEIEDDLLGALTEAYEEASAAADVVIVAAANAYPEYLRSSAYVCQAGRSFRPDIKWMGFYTEGEIKPELAEIEGRRDSIPLTESEIGHLLASEDEEDRRIGEVMKNHLEDHPSERGEFRQVFLLSNRDSDKTVHIARPIKNDALDQHGRLTAWTQSQRYTRMSGLRGSPATTSDFSSPPA